MYKFIIKIVIIMGILNGILSCKEEKDIYVYRTEKFNTKEKEFKISLDQAAEIFSEYILTKEKKEDELFCKLDIIYGDDYIFKKKWEPYNLKTGDYNLSGIWINGNTGKIREVETDKSVKIILEPNKHISYIKKL